MSDTVKLAVGALCVWLVVGQCGNPSVSTGRVAGTGAAVGVGVGAGLAGTAAVGAAARGAAKGIEERARDRVAQRPNGPARPTPSTTIPPAVTAPVAAGPVLTIAGFGR